VDWDGDGSSTSTGDPFHAGSSGGGDETTVVSAPVAGRYLVSVIYADDSSGAAQFAASGILHVLVDGSEIASIPAVIILDNTGPYLEVAVVHVGSDGHICVVNVESGAADHDCLSD
jgi:hypothetical protein